MRIVKNPNQHSCLVASAAMVFGQSIDSIIKVIGHDGSERSPSGQCRGFHIQEIQAYASYLGKHLVPIEPEYGIQTPDGHIFRTSNHIHFNSRLQNQIAILTGYTPKVGHACAWDGEHVIDPRMLLDPPDFVTTCAWLII